MIEHRCATAFAEQRKIPAYVHVHTVCMLRTLCGSGARAGGNQRLHEDLNLRLQSLDDAFADRRPN